MHEYLRVYPSIGKRWVARQPIARPRSTTGQGSVAPDPTEPSAGSWFVMAHPAEDLAEIPFTTERESRRTGNWRFSRPELDEPACIMCELCIEFCPDVSIHRADSDDHVIVDYEFCKGCGICAQVCPTDAFRMEGE